MQGGLSSLVWSVARDEAPALMALDDAAFLARLQQAFGWRLGRFLQTGQRHVYPLVLTVADYPLAQRTVLVGNAAHLLHPIAGQGFNLGMRDLDLLTQAVGQALAAGRISAALRCSAVTGSSAKEIRPRRSGSPPRWPSSSPMIMTRWWRAATWRSP